MDADLEIWDFASDGKLDRVVETLVSGAVSVDDRDEHGRTALHFACDRGHELIVSALCTRFGANVNVQDHMGYTPLHNAASAGRADIVQFLLDHGADPSICDADGLPASHDSPADIQEQIRLHCQ